MKLPLLTCFNRNVWHELRDIAILIALGFLMTLTGFSCDKCEFGSKIFWIMTSFTSLMWVILWKGNDYLGEYISTKISWLKKPAKRFYIGLLATMVFTFAAMYLITVLYTFSFRINVSYGVLFSVMITLIISLFMHGRAFLLNWRQSAIDAEKLQRESIAAKFEALKSQVNPHFLFNSFNALSNLVHDDPDKAVKFIKQLSEVYRYVLDTRDKELVSMEEELQFLKSYLYLQQMRFGDKLRIDIEVNNTTAKLAPLALQMLIENAIKHNIVSEDDPLKIKVYTSNGHITVENNLQRKLVLGEPSTGLGLENICKRYEFLSSRKVEVEETTEKFIVRLPIITT